MGDLDGYQVCDEIGFHWIAGGVDLWVCAVWAFVELVGVVGFVNWGFLHQFSVYNTPLMNYVGHGCLTYATTLANLLIYFDTATSKQA